jgi:uncharacterized membrane protein
MSNAFHFALFALIIFGACNSPEPQTSSEGEPAFSDEKLLEQAEPDTANLSTLIISGTEPFWNLNINQNRITFTEMGGDTLTFAYQTPLPAQGRQPEYLRLYSLDKDSWVLVRKSQAPCSDGMSDKAYEFTATLWLKNQLWDGCGRIE